MAAPPVQQLVGGPPSAVDGGLATRAGWLSSSERRCGHCGTYVGNLVICTCTNRGMGQSGTFPKMTLTQIPIFLSVDCLFLRSPSSIPYGTHPGAKRAANPDPPPVIPLPDTGVAEVTSLPSPRSLGEPRPNRLSSVPGSASGPKCFQVLGLSPSLLQNPML
jgi:hypothetical protein